MSKGLVKPYTEIDGVSCYDEFDTVLSGELTSIPSPLMPNLKPQVNSVFPEGRVYSVTFRDKGELGVEVTVKFSTYEQAREFFRHIATNCKTASDVFAWYTAVQH